MVARDGRGDVKQTTTGFRDPRRHICQKQIPIPSCNNFAPFTKEDETVFLEVHHLRQLSDGGSDRITNAIASCPNCHRELHYGKNKKQLLNSIYKNIKRLIVE